MRKLQNWTQFYNYITEALGEVKTRPGDPFEYKVEGDHWLARRKGSTTWYEITGKNFKNPYQKSINILDTEFPDERSDKAPKREVSKGEARKTPTGKPKTEETNGPNNPTSTTSTTTQKPTTTNTTTTTTKNPQREIGPEGPIRPEPVSPVFNRQFDLPIKDGLPTFDGARMPPSREIPDDDTLKEKFQKLVGEELDQKFESDCNSIGLPYKIALRQIWTESNFNPIIKSKAGAVGLCQFLLGTWNHYGGKGPRTDIAESLRLYILMMKDHLDRFPRRLDIAVAGYNSGPNLRIYKKAVEEGIPFAQIQYELPRETRKYANIIFA
jgi:hypothetical protein